MMGKACVFILMTQSVDEGFLVGGRIDAKFLRLDFCGDTLALPVLLMASGGKTIRSTFM